MFLGHLPLIVKLGGAPHVQRLLSELHGPVFKMFIGRTPMVVITDPDMARTVAYKLMARPVGGCTSGKYSLPSSLNIFEYRNSLPTAFAAFLQPLFIWQAEDGAGPWTRIGRVSHVNQRDIVRYPSHSPFPSSASDPPACKTGRPCTERGSPSSTLPASGATSTSWMRAPPSSQA